MAVAMKWHTFPSFAWLASAAVSIFFLSTVTCSSSSKTRKLTAKKPPSFRNAPRISRLSVPWSLYTWTPPREDKAGKRSKNPNLQSSKLPFQPAEILEHGPIFSLDGFWSLAEDYAKLTTLESIVEDCSDDESEDESFDFRNVAFLLLKERMDPSQISKAYSVSLKLPLKRNDLDALLNGIFAKVEHDFTCPILGFVLIWHEHSRFLQIWLTGNNAHDSEKAVSELWTRCAPDLPSSGNARTRPLVDELNLIVSNDLFRPRAPTFTQGLEVLSLDTHREPSESADVASSSLEEDSHLSSSALEPEWEQILSRRSHMSLLDEHSQCEAEHASDHCHLADDAGEQSGETQPSHADSHDNIFDNSKRPNASVTTDRIICTRRGLFKSEDDFWIQMLADLAWSDFETFVNDFLSKFKVLKQNQSPLGEADGDDS